MDLKVGAPVSVDWNGSKYFTGDTGSFTGRVEAVGYDWLVIRDSYGEPRVCGGVPEGVSISDD